MKIAVAFAHIFFATLWLGRSFSYAVLLLPRLGVLDVVGQRALRSSLRSVVTPLLAVSAWTSQGVRCRPRDMRLCEPRARWKPDGGTRSVKPAQAPYMMPTDGWATEPCVARVCVLPCATW